MGGYSQCIVSLSHLVGVVSNILLQQIQTQLYGFSFTLGSDEAFFDLMSVLFRFQFLNNILKFRKFPACFLNINNLCINFGGARGVIVIVVGNEHGDTSSNPGRD